MPFKPFTFKLDMGLIFRPQKPAIYRNMRVWVHATIIPIAGFFNLIYATGVIPIISQAITDLNKYGFSAFFKDTPWLLAFWLIVPSIVHTGFAIFCLVCGVASLDVLKDRLINFPQQKPS